MQKLSESKKTIFLPLGDQKILTFYLKNSILCNKGKKIYFSSVKFDARAKQGYTEKNG